MIENDEVLTLLRNKFDLYHQEIKGKRELIKFRQQVVVPIQRSLVEASLFRQNSTALKVVELGQRITHMYFSLRVLVVQFRLQYRKFYQYVNEAKQELKAKGEAIR
ncbi:hypothetical protein [Pontibacter russatus]|uniref:hypothetical protein n=1 Tax=Pontibacter russatus TaxID=2694929 RepID=UPI00137B122A|nr:hypothetical protein [Pontibacter russatus]